MLYRKLLDRVYFPPIPIKLEAPVLYCVENIKLYLTAMQWAQECHRNTNHLYDGKYPYFYHLKMVHAVGKKFEHLLPQEAKATVFAAIWAHDLIEDCRITYNDIKEKLGVTVADIVYACTNEKGKTRKDRANDKFYSELQQVPYANFVKICDRIANMEYSYKTKSRMGIMYVEEFSYFVQRIHDTKYAEMFSYMGDIVDNICEIMPTIKEKH